jgi:uncharacterized damage-inducible protein DinB
MVLDCAPNLGIRLHYQYQFASSRRESMVHNAHAELLDVYRATPVILRRLVHEVDDTVAVERSAPGDWSIVEIVAHLIDADRIVMERVERMVREDRPTLAAYDEAALAEERDYRSSRLSDVLDRFAETRRQQIAQLESLADSDWARSGLHEEVGEITVEALVAHMAAHDVNHLAQIAQVLDSR